MSKRWLKRSSMLLWGAVATHLLAGAGANSAEIKLLSPQAMKPALSDLIPQFERSSGNKVVIDFAGAAALTKRIEAGEVADAVILSPKSIQTLQGKGKLIAASDVVIAKVGFGVVVRKGAAKLDLNSVDALRRTLLAAKSIGIGDPARSASGRHFTAVVERLGLATELKSKMKLFPSGTAAMEAVSKGEVELTLEITSAANRAGVELAGPLPPDMQSFNVYAVAILANGQNLQAAKAWVGFVSSPDARSVFKAKGFELP